MQEQPSLISVIWIAGKDDVEDTYKWLGEDLHLPIYTHWNDDEQNETCRTHWL